MYKEYPHFYYYDTREYGRKSRTDDPLLSTAEQYGFDISKGLRYYTPPYKITIELKCD